MALAPLQVPAYPDVPFADGVPDVNRALGGINDALFGAVPPLLGDLIGFGLSALGLWGIFSSTGIPVVTGDNVAGVEYQNDWRVATFPVQRGGFVSYDKVATPFAARVTFTISGGQAEKAVFLKLLDLAAASLFSFTIVTPEFFYKSANIIRYGYTRTAKAGAQMFAVEVDLQEVRIVSAGVFTAAKTPSGADPVSGGTVQPGTPVEAAAAPVPESPATTTAPVGTVTQTPLAPPPVNPDQYLTPEVYLPHGATT